MKFKFLFSIFIIFSLIKFSYNYTSLTNNNEESYCTTWSSSQYLTQTKNLPPISFSNNSIREIVHISASGENIRIKFTNKFGTSNLEILSATIADSVGQGSGEIDLNTLTQLTFNGKEFAKIPPGENIYSDTFSYNLKALSEIAISIYFGAMPKEITGHSHSQTYAFLEEGNKINEKQFSKDIRVTHWYVLSAVEVSSVPRKNAVICFGDSITDGHGSTNNIQGRWTDYLSKKLNNNKDTSEVAVINEGIRGNQLTRHGINRYKEDVLDIKGATYIIVLFGINDINSLNATVEILTNAYKEIIRKAHLNNKFIFGGTILPYGKNSPWTQEREKIRLEVNEWIRNTKSEEGGFDSFFDFDKIMKDPNDEKNLLSDYDSGDGIHPNSEGYKAMVNAIDNLSLFTKLPNFNIYDYLKKIEIIDKIGIKFKLNFNLQTNEEVSIKVNGTSNGSKGFRILLTNEKGLKNSDYFYTGIIAKGEFEFIIKLKVENISNYFVIRRPISTINIDNVILNFIEIEKEDDKEVISPGDEGEFL